MHGRGLRMLRRHTCLRGEGGWPSDEHKSGTSLRSDRREGSREPFGGRGDRAAAGRPRGLACGLRASSLSSSKACAATALRSTPRMCEQKGAGWGHSAVRSRPGQGSHCWELQGSRLKGQVQVCIEHMAEGGATDYMAVDVPGRRRELPCGLCLRQSLPGVPARRW